MANQQPNNVWAARSNMHSTPTTSRTPQNRSGTASPSQNNASSQPPKDNKPAHNVWQQRAAQAANSASTATNGPRAEQPAPTATSEDQQYTPAGGFNAAEVKATFFPPKSGGIPASYKPQDAPGAARGNAWAKPGAMSNGQSFFQQLAKQVATLQGGGG